MPDSKAQNRPQPRPQRRRSSAEAVDDVFDDLFAVGPSSESDLPRDRDAVLIERDLCDPHPNNPRQFYPEPGLISLGKSMREIGQQQNIVVRPHPEKRGRYQLVAGERRWRSAGSRYGDIPILRAVVKPLSDYEVARIMIEENERREDVTQIARARGLQQLYDVSPGTHEDGTIAAERRATWEEVAASVNLKRRSAARLVALLKLDEAIQERMEVLALTEKHGRALLMLQEFPEAQAKLLREIEPARPKKAEAADGSEDGEEPQPPEVEKPKPRLSGDAAIERAEVLKRAAQSASSAAPAGLPAEPPATPKPVPIPEPHRGTGFDQRSDAWGDTPRVAAAAEPLVEPSTEPRAEPSAKPPAEPTEAEMADDVLKYLRAAGRLAGGVYEALHKHLHQAQPLDLQALAALAVDAHRAVSYAIEKVQREQQRE